MWLLQEEEFVLGLFHCRKFYYLSTLLYVVQDVSFNWSIIFFNLFYKSTKTIYWFFKCVTVRCHKSHLSPAGQPQLTKVSYVAEP